MEFNVVLDCDSETLALLREIVGGAGLTLRLEREIPLLVVDLPVLEDVRLVDQVDDFWRRLHELVKSLSGACKVATNQDDREVRLLNVFYEDEDGERQWLPIGAGAHIILPPIGALEPDRMARMIGVAMNKSPELAKVLRLCDTI